MSGEPGIVVLGAGPSGLSAAHHLGGACVVYEKNDRIGGHCRTWQQGGFLFDEGTHVFFGTGDCADRFVWTPLKDTLVRSRAEIWNNYGGRQFGRYPVQVNAGALAPDLATRCVLGFIEAAQQPAREVRTYAEWCYASFGREFADSFMLRYARKIWTVEPDELGIDWLGSSVGGRVTRPPLEQVVRGAIDKEPQHLYYYTDFAYPERGGFQALLEPLRAGVPNLRLGVAAVGLDTGGRTLRLSDGSERRYDAIVSTMPLPELVKITSDVPSDVKAAAAKLMWTSVRCVNLGISRPDVGPGHWVYFYDPDVPFFRVSFPSKFAPGNAPAGTGSISCEIAYSRRRPIDEEDLTGRVKRALVDSGILRADDTVLVEGQVDVPYAYVVFDFERAAAVETIHAWMRSADIHPCGRYSEWGYHWSFDGMESGKRAAQGIAQLEQD